MPRRLPFCGYGPDPLGPLPAPDERTHAVRYLAWFAEKHRIELPEGWDGAPFEGYAHSSNATWTWVDFNLEGEKCIAVVQHHSGYVTRPSKRHTYRTEGHTEELARVVLPAWAVPVKSPAHWHEAHQAGLPMQDCYYRAMYRWARAKPVEPCRWAA